MVNVTWTEIAIEDLSSIHQFISRDSKLYADRFIAKIIKRVDQLENFTKSGRVVPEFNNPDIRELIEANYRIIYKISTSGVSVIRIHHSARRLK